MTARLKGEYLGTVIAGGVEGIQVMPRIITKKIFTRFERLGEHFAKENEFSSHIKNILRNPYQLSSFKRAYLALGRNHKDILYHGIDLVEWKSQLSEQII